MQKCTYFGSRSFSLLCVLLLAMVRDCYASEYLKLRIAISRKVVVKLRENKVHLSAVASGEGDESKIDQQQSPMISPLLGPAEGPLSTWPERKLLFTKN